MPINENKYTFGACCFIAGIGLIKKPGVRRFVVFPILLNVVLFSLASWLLWEYAASFLDDLLPSWLNWLAGILMPLFAMSLLTVVYFSFTLVANIIAAPFYSYLAENVELILSGKESKTVSTASFVKGMMLTIVSELRKISYYLIRALPLLILSFIPGINVIALPLWLLFSAWFLTFEYSGYALENQHKLFAEQKAIIKKDRLSALTFGGLSLLATTIPVVNLIAPAIAVAGATKMLHQRGELNS